MKGMFRTLPALVAAVALAGVGGYGTMERWDAGAIVQGSVTQLTSAGAASSATAIGPGGLMDWRYLGPDNVGGPASYVGYGSAEANLMHLVSRAGDVFQSTDGGSHWSFLSHVPLRDAKLAHVAGDPQTIYAFAGRLQQTTDTHATALFKSEDGGVTWTEVRPAAVNQQNWLRTIDSVRPVPGQPGVLWAATWYGLIRSADDGATWSLVFNGGGITQCRDLQVSVAAAKVYAACANPLWSVVAANLDGSGWSYLTQDTGNDPEARLAMAPGNPGVLYLATFGPAGATGDAKYLRTVRRSVNAGASWETRYDRSVQTDPVSAAVPGDFEFECGSPGYGVLTRGAHDVAVDPANPDRLWVSGFEIYRSDDAGARFGRVLSQQEQITEPALGATQGLLGYMSHGSLAFAPNYNGTTVQVLFAAGHHGVTRTANAGASGSTAPEMGCADAVQPQVTWQTRNTGFSATRLVHGSIGPNGELLVSGPDMSIGLSDGSGPAQWARVTPLLEWPVGQTSIDPLVGIDHLLVGWSTGLTHWRWDATTQRYQAQQRNFVDRGNLPGYVLAYENEIFHTWMFPRFVRDPANPSRLVSGSDDGVFQSLDGGGSWALISPNMAVESYGFRRNGAIVASTAEGRLLVQTAPGSHSWEHRDIAGCLISSGLCTAQPVHFTQFVLSPDPADQGIFATAETAGMAKFWYSTDGIHWNPLGAAGPVITDYLGSTFLAIDPDNPKHQYAGTPLGLYVSIDRGVSWEAAQTPFPQTAVSHVEFRKDAAGGRLLYVFTYGRGAWAASVAPSTTFGDVPTYTWAADYVQRLYTAGITTGCGMQRYCPTEVVLREQMAVFLLRAAHGGAYAPPVATGMFADVDSASPYRPWIEQLAREGITSGCGAGFYCPGQQVSRGQMAVFLLRAKHGSAYLPPAATGRFGDVAVDSPMGPWIEQLAQEGITGGCSASPARYCPDDPVTREQMAVFLVKTFGL